MPPSPSTDTHDATAARRDLAARLLAEPARLEDALTHTVEQAFHVAPHAHDDQLQLDLICGCSGTAWIDGQRHKLRDVTVMLVWPGQSHGYELLPGQSPSRVYLLKIHVEEDWPFIAGHVLPSLTTGLMPQEALRDAMQAVVRYNSLASRPMLLMLARLTEVLAYWPTGASGQAPAADIGDPQIAPAMHLIDARPADPPTIDELAEACNLSPRHFARRFKRSCGATPHDVITARRLNHAKSLLLARRLLVHQVADQLGFSSVATFSRWFSHETGIPPSQYQSDPSIL
jgi:AraC-like DNA-binding protein